MAQHPTGKWGVKFQTRKTTNFLVIHCSATTEKMNIGAAEINNWHQQRGFVCIGYHYVIRRDGTIEIGRDENVVGAHVRGHNWESIGICMIGGVDADDLSKAEANYTDEQWAELEKLLRALRREYPSAVIQGHRDFPDVLKACPSFDVKSWVTEKGI